MEKKANGSGIFQNTFDDLKTEGKIDSIWELLCELSDDINEMKKQMGLDISIRTEEQRRESRIEYITKLIEDGKTVDEIAADDIVGYPGYKDEQDRKNWRVFAEERFKLVHDTHKKFIDERLAKGMGFHEIVQDMVEGDLTENFFKHYRAYIENRIKK